MEDQLQIISVGREGLEVKFVLFYTATQFEQYIKPLLTYTNEGMKMCSESICNNITYSLVLNKEVHV
jgi:hypothetical protein